MKRNLRLDITPQNTTTRLRTVVTKIFNFTLLGLNTPQIELSSLKFPSTRIVAEFNFSETEAWTDSFAHSEFRLWVLTNAFRDVAEAINVMLEDVYGAMLPVRLAEQVSQKGVVTELAWQSKNGELVAKPAKFHRCGMLDKFKELNKIGFSVHPMLSTHASSINGARNCLTHRSGIVGEKDVDEANRLNVHMYQTFLIATVNGQPKKITLPYYTGNEDTRVGIAYEEVIKSFEIGERIDFSAEEFADICWTLWKMADYFDNQVLEYCKKHGGTFINIISIPPHTMNFALETDSR